MLWQIRSATGDLETKFQADFHAPLARVIYARALAMPSMCSNSRKCASLEASSRSLVAPLFHAQSARQSEPVPRTRDGTPPRLQALDRPRPSRQVQDRLDRVRSCRGLSGHSSSEHSSGWQKPSSAAPLRSRFGRFGIYRRPEGERTLT
jgi:hypothetical protein